VRPTPAPPDPHGWGQAASPASPPSSRPISLGWRICLECFSMKKRNNKTWRSFEVAREYVHDLGLRDLSEWLAWAKSEARPGGIPPNPSVIYKHRGWVNIGDWLGIENVSRRGGNWKSFEKAREFVQSLGLKNYEEWRAWSRSPERPKNIPSAPREVYAKEGWKGFGDWQRVGWS
jgi:hypothetical protein